MNAMKHRLPANERRLLEREMKLQINDIAEEKNKNLVAIILYTLHEYTGWGKRKLKDFYDKFEKINKQQREYYQLEQEDDAFLCKIKLKEIGIDIDEWIKEELDK